MAVVRVLEKEFGIALKDKAAFVAGHSLGEYSAACAAGVFSLADTARLLRARGDAMQKAVPFGVGGMAAVIGVSFKDINALVEACCDENALCVAANDNSDGQVVLSGHMAAIDKAVEIAPEFGAKRCIKLPVSAPFHSPLMQPAAETMARVLMEVEVSLRLILIDSRFCRIFPNLSDSVLAVSPTTWPLNTLPTVDMITAASLSP